MRQWGSRCRREVSLSMQTLKLSLETLEVKLKSLAISNDGRRSVLHVREVLHVGVHRGGQSGQASVQLDLQGHHVGLDVVDLSLEVLLACVGRELRRKLPELVGDLLTEGDETGLSALDRPDAPLQSRQRGRSGYRHVSPGLIGIGRGLVALPADLGALPAISVA